MHLGRIRLDRDVPGAGLLEHVREVTGPAADVQDRRPGEIRFGEAAVQVADQFDGVAGEGSVEQVGCGLFVPEVAEQAERPLQGCPSTESPGHGRRRHETEP